ncbi:hypothetical protein ABEB36_005546 [Hypothenemus hampei]|uniref:Uncharacterized protein n=1 Tax=Hypothenemus hampei TaxID=57062 RepID=A0ABD1F1P6_HYPHA
MPISDDEFQVPMQEPQSSNNMSKAEIRKTHKPIMEKRRRARINNSLNEIKNLILEAMNKDPARHTKLEKADILEMAVKHLQNVQRQQLAVAMASDPSVLRKFKSGFNDCATEIGRFLGKSDNLEGGVMERVSTHLRKCITDLEQVAKYSVPTVHIPFLPGTGIFTGNSSGETTGGSGDQNNNPSIQIPQGIQLIPSRLPTGELALLLPNSSNLSYFSQAIPHRPSAFVTVTPQNNDPPKILSPPLSPVESSRESPRGFRPLPPNIAKPKASYPGEDHQVPQVTSTVNSGFEQSQFVSPMEVKTMKYPIHKPLEKERKPIEHTSVIKKISDPLSIITNQGERYKQAQQREDSSFLEENLVSMRGVKRHFSEMFPPSETCLRPYKVIKTNHLASSTCVRPADDNASESFKEEIILKSEVKEAPKDYDEKGGEQSGDMWRPW